MGGPAWSISHAAVHRLLRRRPLLPAGAAVLVAVSGGQDSLCLLKLLVDLQPKWGWRLHVVHCDHRWRPDSAANAEFVQGLCDRWAIPCHIVVADAPYPTEATARQWRYRVFSELAIAQNCTRVATGHTASDRAETLLYNLLRGSGTDGLQALAWQRPLTSDADLAVVRPLLELTRQQTGEFCRQFDLPIWEDATNHDPAYVRNRIRLELLPYLQAHFNPGVETALAHTAEVLTAEVELLELMAEELYRVVVTPADSINNGEKGEGESAWRIRRSPLQAAPLAIQRRVLHRALRQVATAQVSFEQVETLRMLLAAPNRSQSDPFPGGAIAVVDGEWVRLKRTDS
jgi:tRNA(Ile)-lysidine synthase